MHILAMKKLTFTLILSALLGTAAQAQVTTTPVGFLSMQIAGNTGSGQPAYTFASLGLTNPVTFQSTITSVTTNTIGDTSASWADNAYNSTTSGVPPTYYIEILSGAASGTILDVVSTAGTAQTLTLATNSASLPSLGVTTGTSYSIRQHWTIASVFGTSTLQGGSSTTADQVQLFRNGNYISYYYQSGTSRGLQNTWVQSGVPNSDAGNTVIYPDDGILIARSQSSGVSIVLTGSVKTGQTSIPVESGYTLLGNVYAAGMTLSTSNLFTGNTATGVAGGSSTTADQVMFWNGSNFVSYYYQSGTARGIQNAWVQAGVPNTDAGSTSIPAGAALFVLRNGSPFYWVAPQFPPSFN